MNAVNLTLEQYEKIVPVCTVTHNGTEVRYLTPNAVTKWRFDTLFSKEIETMAWMESFGTDDVMVDIGANVGMYTIWAAKTRGVKVFAFEPESQNYAQLNRNIVLNDLGERVTAYCVALSDRAGYDKFYLAAFNLGESCHAFGESVNFKLEPMRPAHVQGCVAATLDELVANGTVATPTHIKIDVDGFEHKVIAGGQSVLRDPRLHSVLIEINQNLDEHRKLVEHMRDLGFAFSQSQVEQTEVKSGAFKGAANFIFFRSQNMADALGRVVAKMAAA